MSGQDGGDIERSDGLVSGQYSKQPVQPSEMEAGVLAASDGG